MRQPKYHRMFDYRKSLLPNDFLAAMEEDVNDVDAARERSGFTIGYPGWNLLYYCTLCGLDREGENVVVETGTNLGFSTIVLAQALKDSGLDGHVYTVELLPENFEKAKANVERAGLTNFVTLECDDSVAFLRRLAPRVKSVRFAFLDGGHEQDLVVSEFEAIHPLLSDESFVFFDNTYRIASEGEDQRVNGALRIIKKRYGGNLVNFENASWYTPGQAIWQRHGFKKDWEE